MTATATATAVVRVHCDACGGCVAQASVTTGRVTLFVRSPQVEITAAGLWFRGTCRCRAVVMKTVQALDKPA